MSGHCYLLSSSMRIPLPLELSYFNRRSWIIAQILHSLTYLNYLTFLHYLNCLKSCPRLLAFFPNFSIFFSSSEKVSFIFYWSIFKNFKFSKTPWGFFMAFSIGFKLILLGFLAMCLGLGVNKHWACQIKLGYKQILRDNFLILISSGKIHVENAYWYMLDYFYVIFFENYYIANKLI